jgi:trehalose 6-phosphate phosphatase
MNWNRSQRKQPPKRLREPPLLDFQRHALFLDLDGTLLEIQQRPEMVRADEVLRGILRELHTRLSGAIAIISGRAIADVDRVLGEAVPYVSGIHGQEHRLGETVHLAGPSPQLAAAAETMRKLNAGDLLRVLLEHKGSAVAIHYRQAPGHGNLVRRAAEEIAEKHNLKVLHGRMVVEFLPPGASKSDAVTLFMKTPVFAERVPFALGDDATDEDAFAAVRALGGAGVHVGAPRQTLAKHRLANVSAVRSWLLSSLGRAMA